MDISNSFSGCRQFPCSEIVNLDLSSTAGVVPPINKFGVSLGYGRPETVLPSLVSIVFM